jgi:hypothetical protein
LTGSLLCYLANFVENYSETNYNPELCRELLRIGLISVTLFR